MDEYKVYVRTDSGGIVTDINSSAFVSGDGWTEIDCGEGDKFHHAQGNYLERGLTDPDGIYNYKLAGGVPVLLLTVLLPLLLLLSCRKGGTGR